MRGLIFPRLYFGGFTFLALFFFGSFSTFFAFDFFFETFSFLTTLVGVSSGTFSGSMSSSASSCLRLGFLFLPLFLVGVGGAYFLLFRLLPGLLLDLDLVRVLDFFYSLTGFLALALTFLLALGFSSTTSSSSSSSGSGSSSPPRFS